VSWIAGGVDAVDGGGGVEVSVVVDGAGAFSDIYLHTGKER
jgi:hypothetical protein